MPLDPTTGAAHRASRAASDTIDDLQISKADLRKISEISDFNLRILIEHTHEYGWPRARGLLRLMKSQYVRTHVKNVGHG